MFLLRNRNTGRKEYYDQQRYGEAEQLLRQSVQQREKVLGANDVNTFWSKYQLAVTLH
jgi:hypothetical protein